MKPIYRKLFNMLFILATLAFVVIFAFSNSEMTDAWQALRSMDTGWLLAALGCWFCYLFFDSLALHYFLKKQNNPLTLWRSIYISMIGIYYSDITPGASGGQPMQVYYMSKRGVSVGVASSALSIKIFCTQLMVVLMGLLLWAFNADFVATQLGGVRWVIILGVIINSAVIPIILLLALYRPLVQGLVKFCVRVGAKLRMIKNPAKALVRVTTVLDTYHASFLKLSRHPWQILIQLLCAGLNLLGLMGVTVCVYYALGLSGTPWYRILTVAFLLFLSSSYTPLPGASGAHEGGFMIFFAGIFASGSIGLGLLVSRFFTYYLSLLIGTVIVIAINVRSGKSKRAPTQDVVEVVETLVDGAPPDGDAENAVAEKEPEAAPRESEKLQEA